MRKALFVGINNYPAAPLRGCINDSSAMATLLETNGDGSPNFDVKMQNDVSTGGELTKLVVDLFKGEHDIALFYFSGHGAKVNELGTFLVTPDYSPYSPGLALEHLMKIANESKCKNKVIVLDCCHSGALGTASIISAEASLLGKGLTILTASKSDELSLEVNGHGIFTNLLLDALQGGAADIGGNITPGSIYAYIDKALGAHDQRPVFKTNITEFTPLRRIPAKVPADVLRRLTEYFPSPDTLFQLDPSFEEKNSPDEKPLLIEPYANKDNVRVFKELQQMQSVGLIVPVDAPYMYFAAMYSKSCRLTALGFHYWRLVKDKRPF